MDTEEFAASLEMTSDFLAQFIVMMYHLYNLFFYELIPFLLNSFLYAT